MNHLAHFHLASLNQNIEPSENLMGSFLGDYVKGPLTGEYPPGIEAGIELHRRIDAYTDQHAVVKQGYQTFKPPLRRYAPIITDLIYDHFLAKNWNEYHHTSLEEFNQQLFDLSEDLMHHLPKNASITLLAMRQRSTLLNYVNADFIQYALKHISGRLKRANPLEDSYSRVLDTMPSLEKHFSVFFPQVQAFATQHQPLSVCLKIPHNQTI